MRHSRAAGLALVAALSLTGCAVPHHVTPEQTHGTHAEAGVSDQSLYLHPDTSPGAVVAHAIDGARSSVQMEMYTLNDPEVTNALIRAHQRGVAVQVMLNHTFYGIGLPASQQKTFATLQTDGVPVRWAPTGTTFHIKTIVIDDATALVSTANLNQNDYAHTVDATARLTHRAEVAAISDTFHADFALKGPVRNDTQQADGLMWSPGATATMVSTLSAAKKSMLVSTEEITASAHAVTNAIITRARAGVSCTIEVPRSTTPVLNDLKAAGCHVWELPESHHMHQKTIITDNATVVLGSQNDSQPSLERNRELSVVANNPTMAHQLTGELTGVQQYATEL